MIGVVLQGGLGNQMFQYAAGRALAAARDVPLVLATSALRTTRRNETPRNYALGGFRIHARPCDPREERDIARAIRLGAMSRWVGHWHSIAERGDGSDPARLAAAADGAVLRGYWQSDAYFKACAQLIAAEFSIAEPIPAAHAACSQHMQAVASVSVHVRRGDYVNLPSAAAFHGVLSLDYYHRAIQRMRSIEPSPVFFVFTDDVEWCQAHIVVPDCDVRHVSHELCGSAMQDLTLMQSCRHHIIANSSFSWWGAWLAQAGRRVAGHVVAPRQ